MKLIHRGMTYSYNSAKPVVPSVRPVKPATRLHYRGCTYQVTPASDPIGASAQQVTYQLFYRGHVYQVNPSAQPLKQPSNSTSLPSAPVDFSDGYLEA